MPIETRVIFQETPRDFRTETPNIVHELLEAGEISPNDFVLYCTYRRIAGEHGACWVGIRGLEKKTHLSDKTITKSKINLSRPFAMLGGKSLINITPCDRKAEQAETVTIIDIWRENYEFFKNKLTCRKVGDTGAGIRTTRVPESKRHKKEPYKKEPYEESSSTTQTSEKNTNPTVVSSKNDDDDLKNKSFEGIEEEHKDVIVIKTNGERLVMTTSDIYRAFLKKPDIPTEVLKEAIKRIRQVTGPINNIIKYLESVCLGIMKEDQNNKKSFTETKKTTRNYSNFGPIEHKPTITMAEYIRRKQEQEKNK